MSRLRILMLLENNPYPQDARVRREAVSLARAGYEVSVCAPRKAGQARFEVVDSVRIYRHPKPPEASGAVGYGLEYGLAMLYAFAVSLYVFFRRGFDIVHAHNPPDTFVFIGLLYKLVGRKFVFDHHDLSPEMFDARFGEGDKPALKRILLFLERLSVRSAEHTIVTNESYKTLAVERSGVPEIRVSVVRNGPELARFEGIVPDETLAARPGSILAYVGTMGPQDGLDYLLKALQVLVFELGHEDVHCVLIGDGDALPGLKRLAAELKVEPYVDFTGRLELSELLPLVAAADICLDPDPSNPYNDRSTMIKLTEYMALAKPIVAFDLPEHRVSAGEAALYAKANKVRAFAQGVADLLADPVRRERMGKLGRERVETQLSWRYSELELLRAYEKLSDTARVDS